MKTLCSVLQGSLLTLCFQGNICFLRDGFMSIILHWVIKIDVRVLFIYFRCVLLFHKNFGRLFIFPVYLRGLFFFLCCFSAGCVFCTSKIGFVHIYTFRIILFCSNTIVYFTIRGVAIKYRD